MTASVFIVDDDPAVRSSLASLLEAAGFSVLSYVSSEDFLANHDPQRSGCLLTNVSMPGMSGLELADVLAGRGIRLPIIFLTAYGDIPMSVRAMKGGAIDFLEKPVPAAAIISRVNEALRLHRQQHERDITIRAAREKLSRLTAREHEVMRLVLNGDHNKVIARRLGISHRTVELHRSRIMGKLGVTSLVELVNIATAAGLVVPPGI